MRTCLTALTAAAAVLFSSSSAIARNIVLANDDGLTSNVIALYKELKKAGHDVIVAVPCVNQSGMGAAAYFGKPLPALAAPCRSGAAAIGDPGAGPMTRLDIPTGDFYYAAGTPVMAMLYGVDVVAKKRWGKAPDLVLSGPNEGQNVGSIILSSGTVSNVQYAAVRGIPAIAVSGGGNSADDATLANPVSRVIAERTVELVSTLDKQAGSKPILPSGLALNVNMPDNPESAGWRLTRIGTYNAYEVSFSDNMARDASPTMLGMAKHHGMTVPAMPGVILDMNTAAPADNQRDDESVVYRNAIAVSPMRIGYDGSAKEDAAIGKLLRVLLRSRGATK